MAVRLAAISKRLPSLKGYAIAAVTGFGAVALTVNTPLLERRPYLASFCAVVVAAWVGGFGPALACAAATFLTINAYIASRDLEWTTVDIALAVSFAISSTIVAFYGRRRARRLLHAAHQSAQLEAIFGQASVGIAVVNADDQLTRMNRRLTEILGRLPLADDELTWATLSHPDDWPRYRDEMRELLEGRRLALAHDQRLMRGDGTPVWVHVSMAPLLDRDRQAEGLIAIVEDIDERKAAEERLRVSEISRRQSEDQARLALDIAHLGTWSWDPHRGLVAADARTREICGFPDSVMSTADVLARTHPDDRERVEDVLIAAAARDGHYSEEFRFVHADSTIRWVVARGQMAVRRDSIGARERLMHGSVLDVTERRQIEEALRQADRQKDDFLALLAHELRNPLAPIRTAVQLLQMRGGTDDDGRRLYAVIERQVKHLVRLVDDLLDVSRVLRGKVDLSLEEVDIADVVAIAVETARPLIDTQRQELTVRLPESELRVHGDQVRLSQVIANLLNNASKYTPRGGAIALDACAIGNDAVLSVKDSGSGIAPELLPTIFEPFVQADRSLERVQGGLGIGLTLVRKIVELHGGSVSAQSDGPMLGSEFTVRLPILHSASTLVSTARPPAPATATNRLRLLVVDDNTDAADSLAMLLTTMGHVVGVAHDGHEAVSKVESLAPDVVLLDIGLPGMNGYEVAAEVRRRFATRPTLIAVTGYGQESDAKRAVDSGFDAHLIKPVDAATLDAVLANCITSRANESRTR